MNYTMLSPVVGRKPDVPPSIRMYPIGDSVHIAFCDGCFQPHYLEVAGTLYVFMQDGLDFDGVIAALINVIDRLPVDSCLYGIELDVLVDTDWIVQILATEPDAVSVLLPDVRRHL
ncbi:MAG: hypothetical protein ACOVP2_11555 [Armatimonadaceae bacterium]